MAGARRAAREGAEKGRRREGRQRRKTGGVRPRLEREGRAWKSECSWKMMQKSRRAETGTMVLTRTASPNGAGSWRGERLNTGRSDGNSQLALRGVPWAAGATVMLTAEPASKPRTPEAMRSEKGSMGAADAETKESGTRSSEQLAVESTLRLHAEPGGPTTRLARIRLTWRVPVRTEDVRPARTRGEQVLRCKDTKQGSRTSAQLDRTARKS